MQQQWTISQSDCEVQRKVDCIQQPDQQQPAQWLGWGEAPKHFPKANSHPCLVVCGHWSTTMNPSETIISENYAQQTYKMQWKLQWLQPALVNRKEAICLQDKVRPHVTQPTLQKLSELGYRVLLHLPCSPDSLQLTVTSSSISTTFCRGTASTSNRRKKMLSKSLLNPEAWIFMLQG